MKKSEIDAILKGMANGTFKSADFNELEQEEKEAVEKALDTKATFSKMTAKAKELAKKDAEAKEQAEAEAEAKAKEDAEAKKEAEEKADKDADAEEKDSEEVAEKSDDNADTKAEEKKLDSAFKKSFMSYHKGLASTENKPTYSKEAGEVFRKAILSERMKSVNIVPTVGQGQNDATGFTNIDIASQIFERPEGGTGLLDNAYRVVVSGNTVRFNEVARATATNTTEGQEVTFGNGATLSNTEVTLQQITSTFNISRETIEDANVNVQELLVNKAVDAIRRNAETSLATKIVGAVANANKVDIAGSKGSNPNNLPSVIPADITNLGSFVESENNALYTHSTTLALIRSARDTQNRPLFAYQDNTLEGVRVNTTVGLDTASTLRASTTDGQTVAIFGNLSQTCGVAVKANEILTTTQYDIATASYNVRVDMRIAVECVVPEELALLTLSV